MTKEDAEGKRGESPAQGAPAPDAATRGAESAAQRAPSAGPPAGGMAVPPQRASDRAGEGGIEEAGLGAGTGDLGAGGDLAGDVGRLDEDDHSPDG